VKSELKVNVSVGEMSLPLGCLVRGRSLAQARDWRVRFTSCSAGRNISIGGSSTAYCVVRLT
jgi:hypothetical protein